MRSLAWVVLAVGCADIPDSDIDQDGIADDADDCIAGFTDEAADVDGDGKDATVDLCPLDAKAAAGDTDLDGIPEACDPFPVEMTRPDTRRCVTSFGVRWMNASYLVTRAGEAEWNLEPPLHATTGETVSVFSSFEKQYKSTTYEVQANAAVGAGASFLMYVRANAEQPTSQDVACGIDDQNLFVWANGDKHALVPLPGALDGGVMRLRATSTRRSCCAGSRSAVRASRRPMRSRRRAACSDSARSSRTSRSARSWWTRTIHRHRCEIIGNDASR